MEGYEAGEDKTQQEERVLQIQEAVMVWFLFLFQVFSQPLPSINKKIISCRTRKSTGGRYSSRRVTKTAVPELTTDLFAEETTLDSLDLVEYFTGLAEALLGFLLKKGLSEDAHNQCVKVVVLLNAQLPRLQSADTNEVRICCLLTSLTDIYIVSYFYALRLCDCVCICVCVLDR